MRTRTFKPTKNRSLILSELAKNIELACKRLRAYDLEAWEMSAYLKTQSFSYKNISFRFTSRIAEPTIPLQLLTERFNELYTPGVEYRASGITFHNIAPTSVHQKQLFTPELDDTPQSDEKPSLFSIIDSINSKYRKETLYLARSTSARTSEKGLDTNIPPLSIPFWGEMY